MTFSRVVGRVIDVARRAATAADADLRRRHPRYPIVNAEDLPGGAGEGGTAELERMLGGLPAERVFALAYLMGVGRGEVGAAEAGSAMGQMKRAFRTPGAAAKRLASRAGLAEDLADGLAELARAGVDVDRLVAAAAPSVRRAAEARHAAAGH